MSVCSKLHAGEIDCLISRLVDEVRWLGVFARDPGASFLTPNLQISMELTGSLSMHLCLVVMNYLIYLAFFIACIV